MPVTQKTLYETMQEKTTVCLTRVHKKVSVQGSKVIIERDENDGGEVIEVELDKIRRVMLCGKAEIGCEVLRELMKRSIAVDFMDVEGRGQGQLMSLGADEEINVSRQVLFDVHPEERLELARRILRARADNAAVILRKRTGLCDSWESCKVLFKTATDADQLRGAEGFTARTYFGQWNNLLEEGQWKGRIAHPAPDPVNAMLSFGYMMLHNRFGGALRAHGLNPRLGFFHQGRGSHWALASDLMEPFRPFVDHVVLKLVRHHEVKFEQFEVKDGRCVMKDHDVFSVLLKAFEKMFSAVMTLFYPADGDQWMEIRRTVDDHIEDQVVAYAGMLGGRCRFEPLRIKPCREF